MNRYTDTQVDILLNCYFRDQVRPMPYPEIKERMLCQTVEGLDDLLWRVITGYGGNTNNGPRRVYTTTEIRLCRVGWPWQAREDTALRVALGGDGQLRTPPVDIAYIAAVLARNEPEVRARWKHITGDPLGREGFFQ